MTTNANSIFFQNFETTLLLLVLDVQILTLKMSVDACSERDLMILRDHNIFNA